jgi:deoxyribodipyrimidine photolyase-related protein
MKSEYSTLRLVLGDQLNIEHSWFRTVNPDILYLMMEVRQETDYTVHHIQKVAAFFLAMRLFHKALSHRGHHMLYLALDDEANQQSVTENLHAAIARYGIKRFEYQLPDEYRVDAYLKAFSQQIDIEVHAADTEHFVTHRQELAHFFKGKRQYLMENFYRSLRQKHDVLMDAGSPAGGTWNYDQDNRKKLPKNHQPPPPHFFDHDVTDIVDMLTRHGVKTMGVVNALHLAWPVTRAEALEALQHFLKHMLPRFGDFQDAMSASHWSLYHSRLSFALNTKLLSPMEVIRACESVWQASPQHIDISQAEGFIRQILGWREYMRGVYWAKMPDYAQKNYFDHQRKLPEYFWTAQTKMNCVHHAVKQSLEKAYAHHIQRLMVTGNFALLAGIDPDEVDHWYLGIYIDALQWVEITNTRGMSQFADGGVVGTKPYVSSANYIHKMSDYCTKCHYAHKERTTKNACPFNSLYWNFYDQHRLKLEKNPRIGMVYRLWDKMDATTRSEILEKAAQVLDDIENL